MKKARDGKRRSLSLDGAKESRAKECAQLFWIFFKIGMVLFGGGYAILPFLQREFVEKRGWITNDEITDYFAIGQCTPGIIAVNTATFVGYKRHKALGGAWATLGVISPSIIIITAIAALLTNFMEIAWVQHAFAGIRAVVAAMIVGAVIKLIKSGVRDWFGVCVFLAALLVGVLTSLSPVFVVLGALALGLIFRREKVVK